MMLQKLNTIDTENLIQYTNTNKRETKLIVRRELLKGGDLSIGKLIEERAPLAILRYQVNLSGEFSCI